MGTIEQDELGKFIKHQITVRGISQNKLAEKAGISKSGLSAIIKGSVSPKATTIKLIADALQVSPYLLFSLATGIPETSIPGSPVSGDEIDSTLLYTAKRINDLSDSSRGHATSIIREVADIFSVIDSERKFAQENA